MILVISAIWSSKTKTISMTRTCGLWLRAAYLCTLNSIMSSKEASLITSRFRIEKMGSAIALLTESAKPATYRRRTWFNHERIGLTNQVASTSLSIASSHTGQPTRSLTQMTPFQEPMILALIQIGLSLHDSKSKSTASLKTLAYVWRMWWRIET